MSAEVRPEAGSQWSVRSLEIEKSAGEKISWKASEGSGSEDEKVPRSNVR